VKGTLTQVALLDELNVATHLDHFPGDLVAQDQSRRRRGAAADHVLIRPADVGANDLQDHAVLTLAFLLRQFELGEVDALNLDLTRTQIRNTSIGRHRSSQPKKR